jgi:hypothetical protein
MNISALDTQVLTAYETLGMSPEEIAGELQINLEAVIYSLSSNSPSYRKFVRDSEKANSTGGSQITTPVEGALVSTTIPNDVSDAESQEMLEIMKQIARAGDNEDTRFKAAKYIFEEKKGRNAAVVERIGSGLSLAHLNNAIQDAVKRASAYGHIKPVIDIKPLAESVAAKANAS